MAPGLGACGPAPKLLISTREFHCCYSPHQLPPHVCLRWQGTPPSSRSSKPQPKHLHGTAAKVTFISATGISHHLAWIHVSYLWEANDRNPDHPKLRVIESPGQDNIHVKSRGVIFPTTCSESVQVIAKIPPKMQGHCGSDNWSVPLQSGQSILS